MSRIDKGGRVYHLEIRNLATKINGQKEKMAVSEYGGEEGMGKGGLGNSLLHNKQSKHVIYSSNHNTSESQRGYS